MRDWRRQNRKCMISWHFWRTFWMFRIYTCQCTRWKIFLNFVFSVGIVDSFYPWLVITILLASPICWSSYLSVCDFDRGNLSLMLLPTSDLRISFIGDDGSMERLATLSREAQSTSLEIEEIYADKSGRSFLLRIADNMVCYYWCSEKSLLLGREMLGKVWLVIGHMSRLSICRCG